MVRKLAGLACLGQAGVSTGKWERINMKNVVCLVATLLGLGALPPGSATASGGPTGESGKGSSFREFAVSAAHKRGFVGCDDAIRSVFKTAGGDDIRVVTDVFDETKRDSLKMTAAWGREGDSVLAEAEFRKSGAGCLVTTTTILTSSKSCTAYAAEMHAFKYTAEAPGHIWMKNAGGANLILRPMGGSCVAIFQVGQKL